MILAKILLDSINSSTGDRITTWELTYPRFIHAELMTHRVFSRNAASSRAIPVMKMIMAVLKNPAEPVWWGKNQGGMQAKEELNGWRLWLSKKLWFWTRYPVCLIAWLMVKLNLHKQIANRILEPWMHMTVILTATEYKNFFKLRAHPDAQPEFQALAYEMKKLYDASEPGKLKPGEWHVPLVSEKERFATEGQEEFLIKVATARCARVSYTTHDRERPWEEDVKMHERLSTSGHWSPFEHCAQAKRTSTWSGNFKGWLQYRKFFAQESGDL